MLLSRYCANGKHKTHPAIPSLTIFALGPYNITKVVSSVSSRWEQRKHDCRVCVPISSDTGEDDIWY